MLRLKEICIGLLILSKSKCSAQMRVVGLSKEIIPLKECIDFGPRKGTGKGPQERFWASGSAKTGGSAECATKSPVTTPQLAKIQSTGICMGQGWSISYESKPLSSLEGGS